MPTARFPPGKKIFWQSQMRMSVDYGAKSMAGTGSNRRHGRGDDHLYGARASAAGRGFAPIDASRGGDGAKVADQEYQKTFWSEVDEECPKLSDANGLYVFSLRIGENYNPQYVGITKAKDFSKEVFSDHNVVKIQFHLVPKKGALCVHLLAKPKDINTGFYHAKEKSLIWTEMFLLLLCRKKNPEILNIAGHTFLEDCAIEGVTSPAKGKGKAIRTFRDALGFDSFKGQKFSPKKAAPQQPTAGRTPQPISQPTTQPTAVLLASTKTV